MGGSQEPAPSSRGVHGSGPGGDRHTPVLRTLRERGHKPDVFRRPEMRTWVVFTLVVLMLTTVLPLVWPATWPFVQRVGPLASLFFLFAAGALWLAPRRRAFLVSGVLVAFTYAITAWAPLAFDMQDIGVVVLLSSFGVIALAGFNVVFVLEEIVYDTYRLTEFRHAVWRYTPLALVLLLAFGMPAAWGVDAVPWPRVWFASLAGTAILGGWWLLRAFNPIREGPVLVELHLFVFGLLLIGGATDVLGALQDETGGLLPSLVAYLLLVGTWIYVSYTTLQRTQFLLRANNPGPWLCILLSASFALLNHAFLHFRLEGTAGLDALLDQRLAYLAVGLWIGVGFYVLRSVWRVLRFLRDDRRLAPSGRLAAGRVARFVESLLLTETRLETAAAGVYRRVDHVLPGHVHDERCEPSWEFDAQEGGLRRLENEDLDGEE